MSKNNDNKKKRSKKTEKETQIDNVSETGNELAKKIHPAIRKLKTDLVDMESSHLININSSETRSTRNKTKLELEIKSNLAEQKQIVNFFINSSILLISLFL